VTATQRTFSAREFADLVVSFPGDSWPMIAFDALLERLESGTAGAPEVLETVRVLVWRGMLEEKALILTRFFARLADESGSSVAVAAGTNARCPAWALAGAASVVRSDEVAEVLDASRRLEQPEETAIAVAALAAAVHDTAVTEAWQEALEALDPASVWSHGTPFALRILPERLRSEALDILLPGDSVIHGPHGLGPTGVSGLVRLIPSLDQRRVEAVWGVRSRVDGSGLRGDLIAAVAARLAALGDVDAAFTAAEQTPYTEGRALALLRMMEAVPDERIRDWLELAEGIDANLWRDERALLAGAACARLARLTPDRQWQAWSAHLSTAETSAEVTLLLLARAPIVYALGPPAARDDVIASFVAETWPPLVAR
jgi:hypothetical protein